MVVARPLFVSPLNLGTMAAGGATAGHPVTNLNRHKALGLTWQVNGNSWARGDFGVNRDVDFCALISSNAQAGTTLRLRLGDTQAQVDGVAPYDSGALPIISPVGMLTRDGFYHSHLELPSVQSKRHWRIDIGGHSGNFEASMLVLGRKVQQATRFYDYGFVFGGEDTGSAKITRHGVWDEEPGLKMRSCQFTLNWLTELEWETMYRPLTEIIGTSEPVYCVFDPQASIYRQNRSYYGKMEKAVTATGRRKPGTFGGEFNVLSII